jgi:hypothetical protein
MIKLRATAIVAVVLVGLGACSSEKKVIDNASANDSIDVSLPDITLPGGGTLPNGDTLPGGVSIPDASDITIPGGGTLPDISDITIPGGGSVPGVAPSCLAYLQAISGALSGDQTSLDTLENGFKDLADKVPDDLKDDLEVLAAGYALIAEKLKDGGDPSTIFADPEIQALFSNTEFAQASGNVSTWLNGECGQS